MPTQYNVSNRIGDHRLKGSQERRLIRATGQVTLKPEASHEDFEKAKKDVESKGGKITHEFKLIKGFTYVLTSCLMSLYVITS